MRSYITREPFPRRLFVFDGRPLPDVELSLSGAARLLGLDYRELRTILRVDTPAELRRRPERPRWRLPARTLYGHLRTCRPDLAARLAAALERSPANRPDQL
jgi:hypothetical protein